MSKFFNKFMIVNSLMAYIKSRMGRLVEVQLMKQHLHECAYNSTAMGVDEPQNDASDIIVSLTTHGKRIHTVYRAIESLFAQSVKANRIVLYIGNKEYQSEAQLPVVLQKQMKRGLEVRFVDDIGPYTKLLPAMREFPDNNIITVDDDIWYPANTFERILKTHNNHPDSICAIAVRQMGWKNEKKHTFKTYEKQPFIVQPHDSTTKMCVAEGFAGILYPPHCFSDEVFRKDMIQKLAPHADDLWFTAMSLINGTPIYAVGGYGDPAKEIYLDECVQDVGLYLYNFGENGNDKQWKRLCDHYNLYEKLK